MPDPEKKETTTAAPATDKNTSNSNAQRTVSDPVAPETNTGASLSAAIDKIASDKVAAAQDKPLDEGKSDGAKKTTAPAEKKEPEKKTSAPAAEKTTAPAKPGADDADGEVKVNDPLGKAKSKPKTEEQDVSEEEIQDELKTPHKNEKSAQRFRSLYNKWKAADAKIAKTESAQKEKDAKLAALEKEMAELKAGKGATDEQIEKEREELMMYRRRDELDKDPKIKEVYDTRITAADNVIVGVLQKYGVAADIIKKIQDNGGFEEYLRQNGADAKKFLDGIELADSEAIRSALTEKGLIRRAKGEHIKTESSKAKEYFANKAKQEEEARKNTPNAAEHEAKINTILDKWTENAYKQLEYFHTKEIPEDASADEKKQIEASNATATELRELLKQSLHPKTLQDRTDIAIAATLAQRAVNQLKDANERIVALEAELKELKEADAVIPKRGSSITSGTAKNASGKKAPPKSLSEALDRAERGESLDD